MRAVSPSTLALAALCAAGAFTTLAFYEVAVVRYVKHCIGRAKPMVTAFIAFPLGHAVGQAMLSGGALRYRMYTPAGFSATEVGATVLLANLPYALAFGLLLDLALVLAAETLEPLFRISSHWLFALGCLGLAKDAGYAARSLLRRKPIRLGGWAVNLPTPAMTALQLVVGIVDVGLVSIVLYLLLPDSAGSPTCRSWRFTSRACWPACLSHVPAGLGVLESMLLLLLPGVPPEQLLAAVLMYRVIYEIVPVLVRARALGPVRGLFARRRAFAPVRAAVSARGIARRESDHRQDRVSERCGRSRRPPRRAARCTSRRRRPRAISSSTRQGRPSGCSTSAWRQRCAAMYDGARQRRADGLARTPATAGARPPAQSSSRCSRDQVEDAWTTQHCGRRSRPGLLRVAGGPGERPLRPAARLGAEVERPVEREHAGPAGRHAHLGEVAEGAAVRAEQRRRLRGRDGDGDGAEDLVLPARVGLQFPAALARAAVRAPTRRSGSRGCGQADAPARSCPACRSTSPRSARARRDRPP